MTLHLPLVVALAACLAWTLFFSMFNRAGLRGYRNLGILGAYVCLGVFFFRAEWKSVALTWVVFGVAGGFVYTLWEILQRVRTSQGAEKPKVGFTHVFPGLIMWPVMVPEAVEYALAELGILKPAKPEEPKRPTQIPVTDVIVKEIVRLDGRERVLIVQRPNLTFGVALQHRPEDAEVWFTHLSATSGAAYASAEIAEREAAVAFAWLRSGRIVGPEKC